MTFYRHFVERSNFETMVATNSVEVDNYQLPYEPIRFDVPAWWRRIRNSRINSTIVSLEMLHGQWLLPPHVLRAARDFQPDVVFTMAGSWDWTALAAHRLSKKLNIPLIASFNDWFDYPEFHGLPSQKRRIEQRFRRFYSEADLVLCTSDGMKEALGPHPNSLVHYPTGSKIESRNQSPTYLESDTRRLRVVFGGNLGEWYGKMLESLVTHCRDHAVEVEFRIFGDNPSWSSEFDAWARTKQIYCGRVPFAELRTEASNADVLLLVMGFDQQSAHVERTSFKTKFLDYLAFQKPILVWGPKDCTAVRVAEEFDSAERVTEDSAANCATKLLQLHQSPSRCHELKCNARRMYEGRFHPDRIHEGFVNKILEMIKNG